MVFSLLQQTDVSCFAGMSQRLFFCASWLGSEPFYMSLGVHLVGVGEALELVLVEPLHQPHLHRRQLDWLFRESCVEVAHVHGVFLKERIKGFLAIRTYRVVW